ncbi:MAG: 3-hydroxyacyl-CoA dehydrogenase [Parvularculaceae bacterium]
MTGATMNSRTIVGVVGAGSMGAGIAQIAAQAGHAVIVVDQDELALARGRDAVAKNVAAIVKRGKLADDDARALTGRIRWTIDAADLASAGLVIEAIVENAEVKQSLFSKLERTLGAGAVIATNTSSLSVTALARGLARPERFLGLHFFNPAPVMKLVEVVSGAATDPAIAKSAVDLVKSWGKEAVEAKDVPGFIVNRVARPFYGEGWRALEEGAADAATIDFLFRDLAGFRMGPLELGDFIGHDINYTAAKTVFDAYRGKTRFTPAAAQGRLVAAGRLGRKSGAGVYDYKEGAPQPAPNLEEGAQVAAVAIRVSPAAKSISALLSSAGAKSSPDSEVPHDCALIGGAAVKFCDGGSARAEATAYGRPAAILDWMRDPAAASSIAFAASNEEAAQGAQALAAACGKKTVRLKDRPGLVVSRTLLQLANAACDAVRDGVADSDGIDRAMRYGANYPFGPLEWAASYGFGEVARALDAIADETGDAMYRASDFLRAR